MAHVAQWKYGEVEALTNLLVNSKVVGIAEIGNIPAPQLQQMRQNLHAMASIRSAKNRLILRALDEAEKQAKGISTLKEAVRGQAALIITEVNPFQLFSQIKTTRTMAPAKGGETAQHDVMVKAGDTPFKPGPVVGELQKAGIPAAIQEGKVVIREDKVIVPAGEKIPVDVAKMLARLEIFPIEIGMGLNAVFEEGSVFQPEVLDIDLDAFTSQLQQASQHAFALAVETAWITPFTIQPLLMKAYHDATTLAMERNILTKDNVAHLMTKAYQSMLKVATRVPDGCDEDLKNMIT